MNKPILVVMAAGMGSRYGGLKQIEAVSDQGEIITDFSLYDALLAGFERAVFIIKHEIEDDVRAVLDKGASRHIKIDYAFQELDKLPEGFTVPGGRVKPWGTGHAVLCASDLIDAPFAVINADDYYGAHAYQLVFNFLSAATSQDTYTLIGYRLKNTIPERGHVSRGVCSADDKGYLTGVCERKKIEHHGDNIAYTEDDETWIVQDPDSITSMNMWGFTEEFVGKLKEGFPPFLTRAMAEDPLKDEYLLPIRIDELIKSGEAAVKVIETDDRWYGVTYKEDRETVVAALQSMKDSGLYPDKLWR